MDETDLLQIIIETDEEVILAALELAIEKYKRNPKDPEQKMETGKVASMFASKIMLFFEGEKRTTERIRKIKETINFLDSNKDTLSTDK